MYNYNKYATDGNKTAYSSSLSFRPPAHTQLNETEKIKTNSSSATTLSEQEASAHTSSLAPSSMSSPSSQLLLAQQASESRKRPKDIRGIDRFRQVVYGENGFRRLHAMVCREPVLMYPPSGVAEARRRVQDALHTAKQIWLEKARKSRQRQYRDCSLQEPNQEEYKEEEEEEERLREWEEQQYEEELAMLTDAELLQIFTEHVNSENKENELTSAMAEDSQMLSDNHKDSIKLTQNEMELSKYHHKQLDAFIRLIYEFNQATFTKLPLSDTLQMLSRCGKEAVAHVMEYETHVRLAQEKRMKEIKALHAEEEALRRRTLDVELRRTEMELAQAETIEKEQQQQEECEYLENVDLTNSSESACTENIEDNSENINVLHDSTVK